jgi:hypothetical protein
MRGSVLWKSGFGPAEGGTYVGSGPLVGGGARVGCGGVAGAHATTRPVATAALPTRSTSRRSSFIAVS